MPATTLSAEQLVEMEKKFRGGKIEALRGVPQQGHIRWMGLVNEKSLLVLACEWNDQEHKRHQVLEMQAAHLSIIEDQGCIDLQFLGGGQVRLHPRN